MAFALPRISHNLVQSVHHFKGAAVARQLRQHYREPYDLRRLQRVGNRSRMHGSGKVQVGILAQRSVRLTLYQFIPISQLKGEG